MGLGKTKQVCAFLKGLFNTSSIERVLIIAPATLLYPWMKELKTMGLESDAEIYPGRAKATKRIVQGTRILLVSYGHLNEDELYTGLFDGIMWDHVVLDEGHGLKNPRAKRSQNVRKLHVKAGAFIIVSGTVVQNNFQELWALMDICNGNLLGTSKSFRHNFDLTIKLGNQRNLEEITDHYAKEAVKKLQKLLESFYLRREKRLVLQLPDKDELVIWLRPTKIQRKIYMEFLKFYKEKIARRAHKETLPSVRVLETICSHPRLLMDAIKLKKSGTTGGAATECVLAGFRSKAFSEMVRENVIQYSAKFIFLSEMLPKIVEENESVLIFSNSCMMLDLVQQIVGDTWDYKFLRIDGNTNLKERKKAVCEFESGNVPIFLLSIKVGALGLTLTTATKVILLDPSWNPSFDSQAIDRAHRIGQSNEVIVYRLITTGTIEEIIYRTQVYKTTLSRSLHGKEEPVKIFNPKDDPKAFVAEESGFDRSITKCEIDKLLSDDRHEMKSSLRDHVRVLEDKDYIVGVTHHTDVISRVHNGTRPSHESEASKPIHAHAPGPSPMMGPPPSQPNYNYGQPQCGDYGQPAYTQTTPPARSYGQAYNETKYDNQVTMQQPYWGYVAPQQPSAFPQGTSPGYGQQDQYRRPASHGMPQQGPQVQPRAAQPAIMPYQAPIASTHSVGPAVPTQEPYPYASGEQMQQTYPYNFAPPVDGYNQPLPTAAAPGYSQQGVQPVSGYGQPGVQQASGYAQAGATGAYVQHPSLQPGYTEQAAPNTAAAYGAYQGPIASTHSVGPAVPTQDPYPYASGGQMQRTYPHDSAPPVVGYNQPLPTAAAPGYSQQGVQPVSGYGQPGVQQASGYAQAGATGAYVQHPSLQPGYAEQAAPNTAAAYGAYQGGEDPAYSGAPAGMNFKFALTDVVKVFLSPMWKAEQINKVTHKTIAKKVVEKVMRSFKGSRVPQTQEEINKYLSRNKPKLSKFVQEYVDRYQKENQKEFVDKSQKENQKVA